MVVAINAKQFYGQKIFMNFQGSIKEFKNIDSTLKDAEEPEPPKPDPVMENIQQKTNVEDLGEEDMGLSKMFGQGFSVRGGKVKPKNDKLRKFVSLNLK